MGLLTRISGAFGGKASPRSASRSTGTHRNGTGIRDQASSLRAQVGATEDLPLAEAETDSESGEGMETVTRRIEVAPPPPAPPRNRQELFEDLQRNYREAVELIRKVDGHLDRDESRGEQFLAIAKRVDESIPTVERVPDQIVRVGEQVIEALRAGSAADEKRLARLEQSLDQIVSNLERSSGAQVELTSTMAAFRETLTDIERANHRSAEALESMDERRAAREDQMATMLATSKTWLLIALALCVGMGTVAMAISIVSMMLAP